MNINQKLKITQIASCKQSLLNSNDNEISLTKILGSENCQKIFTECREFRDRIYTPTKTIFTFIKQVLDPDKSCKNAVAKTIAEEPDSKQIR